MSTSLASQAGSPQDDTRSTPADILAARGFADVECDGGSPYPSDALLTIYMHALRRRWFVAVSLGLFFAAISAVVVWALYRDQYTATFQFRVLSRSESLMFDVEREADRNEYSIFKNSQQLHVRSDYVLNAALREKVGDVCVADLPAVQDHELDPVRWLKEKIVVQFPGDGDVMNLSITTDSKEDSSILLAAVSKAYLKEVVILEGLQRQRHLDGLLTTLDKHQNEYDQKRGTLQNLAKQLGSNDSQTLSHQQRMTQEQLAAIRKELISIQFDIAQSNVQLQAKKARLNSASVEGAEKTTSLVSQLDLERAVNGDLIIANLEARARELRDSLKSQRQYGRSQNSGQEQLIVEGLKHVEEDADERRAQIESELRQLVMANLASEVTELEYHVAGLKELEKQYVKDEAKCMADVKEYGGSSVEVDRLQREINSLETIINPMSQEAQKLKVEIGRQLRVQRITRVKDDSSTNLVNDADLKLEDMKQAILPKSPDSRSQVSKSIAAGLATFGLVCFGVLHFEVRKKRVNTTLNVSQDLGLQVIGAVPLIPSRAVSRLSGESPRYCRWRQHLNDSMRGVMARLIHYSRSGKSQLVSVSSAVQGEGKSTLATNLAMTLARAGYKTLLVDFDLRRPSLDSLFDMPLEPGVSEVLRGEFELSTAIHREHIDNFSVLTAGSWSPKHVSLLANGDTERLFASLRRDFEFVIVDGSPVLGVAETQLLCRHADMVLLSVLRDVSRAPLVRAACDTLSAFGVNSLYAVVTGVSGQDETCYYPAYGLDASVES